MSQGTFWLVVFLLGAAVFLGSLFLFGWLRRKDPPPPGVKPLPKDDDWN
jgi:hypothetical protein